jgi:hypothetical protein
VLNQIDGTSGEANGAEAPARCKNRPDAAVQRVGWFRFLPLRVASDGCTPIQASYNVRPGGIIVAYAPEFYVPENIIGYTGVLNKNPTVYFLSATHYGHITQVHDTWRNVGRETIRPNARYVFGNVGNNNCLIESDDAAPMGHTSRSAMILVGTGALPPELTHAIMVHPEQKALRLGAKSVVTDENRARRDHPGQQPTDEERGAVQALTIFRWELGRKDGVPPDTRLAAIPG